MYINMEFPVLNGSMPANRPDKKIRTASANKSQGLTTHLNKRKLIFNHLFLDVESLWKLILYLHLLEYKQHFLYNETWTNKFTFYITLL